MPTIIVEEMCPECGEMIPIIPDETSCEHCGWEPPWEPTLSGTTTPDEPYDSWRNQDDADMQV